MERRRGASSRWGFTFADLSRHVPLIASVAWSARNGSAQAPAWRPSCWA